MSVEEIGLACSLVGFVVLAPADEVSTKALVRAAAAHVGPVFIRTGRPKCPIVYDAGRKFEIGKAIEVVEGSDVTIIAAGLLVAQSILAAETLEAEGISARVIDMHTVKPIDREAIERAAAETGAIVVAEEHLMDGGLGVRVAQVVAQTKPCPMEFVGLQDTYAESGQPDELMEKYGLVARDVAAAVRKVVTRKVLARK
jgi:transketolase